MGFFKKKKPKTEFILFETEQSEDSFLSRDREVQKGLHIEKYPDLEDETYKYTDWGGVKKQGFLLKSGTWEEFYKNGQLRVQENFKEGKKHGPFKLYFETGELHQRGDYKEGKQIGLWETFYKSGVLQEKNVFKKGTLCELKYFYKNGKLERDITLKNGFREGPTTYFDEEGNLTLTEEYKDGELIN